MSERLSVISSAIGQPADPTKQFTQPLDFVVEELGLQLDAIPPNTSSSELKYALDVSLFYVEYIYVILGVRKAKQRRKFT
jgi:hypothetical protein